jgi:hypothetical protein
MQTTSPAARQLRFLAFGFLVFSACSKKDDASSTVASGTTPAAASKQADEDLKDISKYRLTMDKFDKYLAASRNIGMKAKSMTPAQRAAMEQRNENSGDPNASLDQMVANIEKEPLMVEAIREAGLSPREFTMITISFMQTGMAAAVAKMRPNENQDSLIRSMQANPDNIRFYNENEAEITRKSKALEAEMQKLGITEG